jgi:hypothetical protein
MNEIMTMRTHLANEFAAAGAKLLDFTMTAGALAAIPNTVPQQYAVAGTLGTITKVLPAAEPSHPQRRLRHGDRPTEPLSFDDTPAAPAVQVIDAPRVENETLGAKLHDTMDARVWTAEFLRIFPQGCADEGTMLGWFANAIMVSYDFANRKAIARQAQPTDRDAIDAERWRFMMAVSDDPESREAVALEKFARDEQSNDTRPESVQMAEAVDAAIAALKSEQKG